MKRILFFLPVLFLIKASAQEPYYDFKKFRENDLLKDSSERHSGKIQPFSKVMGRIVWSDPNDTFILPLDKNMSIDSLEKYSGQIQLLQRSQSSAKLLFTKPDGTRVYALPQDNMPCLVPDLSQFNMPVMGKGIKISGMPPGSAPPNSIIPEK